MKMIQYTGMYLGGGVFQKNPRGDEEMLSYHPPPQMLRISRNFPVRIFSEVYRALPGRKNEFTLVFTVVFLVFLAVSRTARCDVYRTSLLPTGDFI